MEKYQANGHTPNNVVDPISLVEMPQPPTKLYHWLGWGVFSDYSRIFGTCVDTDI